MFVVIYTPGPAWQIGKTVTEQPFYRDHGKYMKRVFAARQLLMGGAFLDDQGGLGILDVEDETQARDIVTHDPAVQARVFEPHLHLWDAYFNRYQEADAKDPIGQKGGLALTNPRQALERFVRQKNVLLTSYRRNGTPVSTLVHIVVAGEHAFVRTWDTAWKFKRIRNNPEVEIAPSTARGQPTSSAIRAHARVLDGSEALHAAHALVRKYPLLQGVFVPLVHRLRGYRTVHIELTPD